jgi:hypothetical protein
MCVHFVYAAMSCMQNKCIKLKQKGKTSDVLVECLQHELCSTSAYNASLYMQGTKNLYMSSRHGKHLYVGSKCTDYSIKEAYLISNLILLPEQLYVLF